MKLKLDTFTWIVIGVVLALLVAAIVTVNLTGDSGWEEPTYLNEDTPAAPVHNAFVALQNGDIFRARDQYSQRILDEMSDSPGYDPFGSRSGNRSAQRLRITDVEMNDAYPDRAVVKFVLDTYSNSGPFGSGSTWSREGVVEVVREDDAWKIDGQEFFY